MEKNELQGDKARIEQELLLCQRYLKFNVDSRTSYKEV